MAMAYSPHDEVLCKLLHRVDAVVLARNVRVDVGQAHLEVMALVPQVGLRLIHDDAAITRIEIKQQRIDLDVGKDALALLAHGFGDELLDPKTEDAPALRREKRELVAALLVVVVKEGGKPDGGIVDGVFAATLLGFARMLDERLEIDARERCGQKPEHRQGGEAAADRRSLLRRWRATLPRAPVSRDREPGSVTATRWRTTSSSPRTFAKPSRTAHRSRRGSMVPPLFDEMTTSVLWDGTTRAARERAPGVGVERLERDAVLIDLVVLRDGHGRLGRSALADEHHRVDAVGHHVVGERLDLLQRAGEGWTRGQPIP